MAADIEVCRFALPVGTRVVETSAADAWQKAMQDIGADAVLR